METARALTRTSLGLRSGKATEGLSSRASGPPNLGRRNAPRRRRHPTSAELDPPHGHSLLLVEGHNDEDEEDGEAFKRAGIGLAERGVTVQGIDGGAMDLVTVVMARGRAMCSLGLHGSSLLRRKGSLCGLRLV
ncbi:uncharacterized protein A4U43_UnF2000 [Asparagus officinalis]|uniref:Uncharacterized protein n=1 Tax=Asparagus officinalis TaxID=4686 RepID=A0A1R3L7D5_ASPOF|nr:uncharacterized protein A4U43_UnF2000 [Asparagus officinalis]